VLHRRRPPAPDQAERARAVAERARNVLIDAGAGTGKTTILVDRLVAMVAPADGAPAVPIERLAALTFTRKAAGELRLEIRERLLEELAEPGLDAEPGRGAGRVRRLREALSGLDTAWVGTIHGFADRLLRLRPVEAALSPAHEIAGDPEPLVRETAETLLHAVENGTLAAELAGTPAADRAAEATRTVLFALGAGLRAQARETQWWTFHGLDGLVDGFIRSRDVPPPESSPPPSTPPPSGPRPGSSRGSSRPCGATPRAPSGSSGWRRRSAGSTTWPNPSRS
jgi:ATP-dependent helicase/nuclease subunit A